MSRRLNIVNGKMDSKQTIDNVNECRWLLNLHIDNDEHPVCMCINNRDGFSDICPCINLPIECEYFREESNNVVKD